MQKALKRPTQRNPIDLLKADGGTLKHWKKRGLREEMEKLSFSPQFNQVDGSFSVN